MINIYLLIFTMVNMYIYNTTKNNFKNLNSEINFRDFIIYYIKPILQIHWIFAILITYHRHINLWISVNLFVEQWCKYTQNFKKYSNIILIFNKFQMDGASLIINVFKAQFLLF